MECRILNLQYTVTNGRKHPVVPGADLKHGYTREKSRWWTVCGPKQNATDKFHPILCYLWEEIEGETNGLFAIFAEACDWVTIDSTSVGESLVDYVAANSDWKTYRIDFDTPDPNPDIDPQDKEILRFEDKPLRFAVKPIQNPTEQNPLVIGNISIVKLWPSIGSTIGQGDRVTEASIKPT